MNPVSYTSIATLWVSADRDRQPENPKRKLKVEIEPRVRAWWAETRADQRHEEKKSPKQKDYPISVRGSRLGDLVETVGTKLEICK